MPGAEPISLNQPIATKSLNDKEKEFPHEPPKLGTSQGGAGKIFELEGMVHGAADTFGQKSVPRVHLERQRTIEIEEQEAAPLGNWRDRIIQQ